jgi:hypothetical protein
MKELRTLALAATPGPWKSFVETLDHGGWKPETQQVTIGAEGVLIATYDTSYAEYPDDERNASNAAFIAAVSPDVVLGLLDRIEALEKGLRECADYIEMDMREHGLRPDYADTNAVNRARSLLKEQA